MLNYIIKYGYTNALCFEGSLDYIPERELFYAKIIEEETKTSRKIFLGNPLKLEDLKEECYYIHQALKDVCKSKGKNPETTIVVKSLEGKTPVYALCENQDKICTTREEFENDLHIIKKQINGKSLNKTVKPGQN